MGDVPDVPSAEAVLQREHAGRRVLLVDDEPINREVAQMLLEEAGLRVDVAENGLEALKLFATHDYSLIVMDLRMPVMDGLEATRRIRADPRGGALPILALTANAFPEDRARCLAVRMTEFLAKPVFADEFYRMVLRCLEIEPTAST